MRALGLIVALAWTGAAFAEPVVTLRANGPHDRRIDISVMGDGYTAGEMLKYSTDVDLLIAAFFGQEPYRSYAAYFNVHRIDVVSKESGADHPARQLVRDTALGARYDCANTARLICIDSPAVNAVLERTVAPDTRDLVIVLVNDAEYGGSGGRFSVVSTHNSAVELALHESGHTLGLLADEYDTGSTCRPNVEPPAVNSTRETARDLIKWTYWIDEGTDIPTQGRQVAVPGLYEGSSDCVAGVFRPTLESKMRRLGRPFDQINSELLIRRFYNVVSPIDSVVPPAGDLGATAGPISLVVQRPKDLPVQWLLDGQPLGPESSEFTLTVDPATLSNGSHTIEVQVRDDTPAVRRDPAAALVERARWTVTVTH